MATTWTENVNGLSAKVVCDSGTGAAPTTAADGMALAFTGKPLAAVSLTAEADASQTLSGGGTLQAYVYDPQAAAWARCPDCDVAVAVSAVRRQAFSAFDVKVGLPGARVAWIPAGVTVSSGGVTVYLNGAA